MMLRIVRKLTYFTSGRVFRNGQRFYGTESIIADLPKNQQTDLPTGKPLTYVDITDKSQESFGKERWEISCGENGLKDPFMLDITMFRDSTKDQPNLIPSLYKERIVGCVCESEQDFINYMVVKEGLAKQCECGNWFQLVNVKDMIYE